VGFQKSLNGFYRRRSVKDGVRFVDIPDAVDFGADGIERVHLKIEMVL